MLFFSGRKSKKKVASNSDEKDIVELSQTLESVNLTGNSDDVGTADDKAIKECCDRVLNKEGITGTRVGLLTVNKKQQNTASPMCRLELAMRAMVKASDKEASVAVETNLNFSSSEEEDDEYLPLSQRLQRKIAKPRVEQKTVKLSTVPLGDPQSQAGGGDNDVMVRAISLGVSSALRDKFSSDSDSEDLQRFLSQPENENFTGKMTSTEYKDKLMDVMNSDVNHDGFYVDDEISYGERKASPTGKYESSRASKGTSMWQRSFDTSKAQMVDKTEFLNIPNVSFTVLTPSLSVRGESKVGTRGDVSTSTPEGQSAVYRCVSRFSHNLSNLSPHLSEDLAGSPLLRFDSPQSSASLSCGKQLQHCCDISAMWESVLSNTNNAHDFGHFEVQTSLLNSFSKGDITDGELSTVTSFTEQHSLTPAGNVLNSLAKKTIGSHETGKEGNINTLEQDSVIVHNNMSVSDNEDGNAHTENHINSVKKLKESTLQVRSALRTVNGQNNVTLVINKCTKDHCIPQASCNPSQDHCLSFPVIPLANSSSDENLNSVCVDKENQSCDGRGECGRKSPVSLVERLRKRLDNHTDSSLIHNIKYGPLSVKPVK